MTGVLWATGTTGRDRVGIEWHAEDPTQLRAGDRYRVMVTDPDGAIIATKEAPVGCGLVQRRAPAARERGARATRITSVQTSPPRTPRV